MSKSLRFHKESGNAAIIALALLVLAGAGAFAYFHFQGANATGTPQSSIETAAAQNAPATPAAAGENTAAVPEIRPGNPVVAKVNGKEINRLEVLNFIQTLPPQTRQMPLEQLYPLALDQLVNTQVILDNTKNVKLENDPAVKEQLDNAREQIVRNVYIQKEVEKKVTDERVQEAYDLYTSNFPDVQEVKARHILVKEESKAKDLIKQLNEGADFATLAKENSTDGTAENGGEVGYFTEKEVVPEFAKAAFALEPGNYTKSPVKTEFGYHIIKSEEKRKRPAPTLEEAKPFLEAQLRRAILEDMIRGWRESAKVEVFDINGDKIEPSAGNEAPAPAESAE